MSSFKPAEPVKIENYQLHKVEEEPSPHAKAFFDLNNKPDKDFFQLNPEISHFIGLTEAKNNEEKRKFDAEVLKFVQKIKDNAFQEAYELGLKQGIEEAKKETFNNAKQDIAAKLRSFVVLCEKVNQMTKRLFEQNEKDIIELSYLMAEKVVHKNLQREPELFLNVFGDVLRSQVVTHIELSEDDYQFFEANKEKFEINVDLAEIKVEINKDLQPGDVLFSNDLGILDGTLQSRFEILRQIVTGLER